MNQRQGGLYPFDCAGLYEIHVLGAVDSVMARYLNGMTCMQRKGSGLSGPDVTVLTGWLPDQAALNGVLNTLYDHGYTLAFVQQVDYSFPSEPA